MPNVNFINTNNRVHTFDSNNLEPLLGTIIKQFGISTVMDSLTSAIDGLKVEAEIENNQMEIIRREGELEIIEEAVASLEEMDEADTDGEEI